MDYSEIEIRGDNDPLSDAIQGAQDMLTDFGQRVRGIFTSITSVTSFDDLFNKVKRGISGFEESEAALRRVRTTLVDLGERAGLSTKDLAEMTTELHKLGSTKDEIAAAQAALLQFRNVRGVEGVFQQTIESAIRLSAVLGGNLVTSTTKIAELLNDPRKAFEDLDGAVATFTNTQKAQIEMFLRFGNIVGAQRVILDELVRVYGKEGAAALDTFSERMRRLDEATEEVWKKIGGFLVPFVNKAIDVMNKASFAAQYLGQKLIDSFGGGGGLEGLADKVFAKLSVWFERFVGWSVTGFAYARAAIDEWAVFSDQAFDRFKLKAVSALLGTIPLAAAWAQATVSAMKPAIDFMIDSWDYSVVLAKFAWAQIASLAEPWVSATVAAFELVIAAARESWSGMVSLAQVAWAKIGEPTVKWGAIAVGTVVTVYRVASAVFETIMTLGEALWASFSNQASLAMAIVRPMFEVFKLTAQTALEPLFKAFEQMRFVVQTGLEVWGVFGKNVSFVLQTIAGGIYSQWVQPFQKAIELVFSGIKSLFGGEGLGVLAELAGVGKETIRTIQLELQRAGIEMRRAFGDAKDAFGKIGEGAPDIGAKIKDAFKNVPGFDRHADFKVDMANDPKLKGLLEQLKKAEADLRAQADQPNAFDAAFKRRLQDSQELVARLRREVDDAFADQGKIFQITGEGKPFEKFFDREGEGRGSASRMEDAVTMFNRIQAGHASTPDVEELKKMNRRHEQEIMVQRQILEAIRQNRMMAHGAFQRTPRLGDDWDRGLVQPEFMGP